MTARPAQKHDAHGVQWADAPWPEVDAGGMAEIDLLMEQARGLPPADVTDATGRALLVLVQHRYPQALRGHVVVLAGSGGNGAGVLAAAGMLAGLGVGVSVVLSGPEIGLGPLCSRQLAELRAIGVAPVALAPVAQAPMTQAPDLILDGLIGYSLRGAPRGRAAALIRWANAQPAPVIALDVPSGFDAERGTATSPVMLADATLALVLPKRGLAAAAMAHTVGALYLADLGAPRAIFARLSDPVVAPLYGAAILRLPVQTRK